jgi:hypothetical protein
MNINLRGVCNEEVTFIFYAYTENVDSLSGFEHNTKQKSQQLHHNNRYKIETIQSITGTYSDTSVVFTVHGNTQKQ